jgi:hypothetical protein
MAIAAKPQAENLHGRLESDQSRICEKAHAGSGRRGMSFVLKSLTVLLLLGGMGDMRGLYKAEEKMG